MRSLPKPLIGLLLGTVAFFAVWMVALKPSSSSTGGSPSGVGQYQSAINQAHQAVKTSNAANAKLGAPTATTTAPVSAVKPATKAAPAAKTKATPAAKAGPATATKAAPATKTSDKAAAQAAAQTAAAKIAAEVTLLQQGVSNHKVVALLFYNPAAADDRAMSKELAAAPTHHGQVVALAVPVSELTKFAGVTAQVPVVTAPTLILIDPSRKVTTLTGYASQLEINQRVADALAAK